jgi:DNA-binding GntR family transcriptional regulator
MPPIHRTPLRQQVRRELLKMVFDGTLPVGERIAERAVAERLGVSRTPVREALMALEEEGIVESRPARGFAPAPLSARDVRETYPLIAALEVLAIRSADPATLPALGARLRQLADELEAAGDDPRALRRLDDRWHAQLVAPSGNERLRRTLEGLKRVVRRYELAWLDDGERVELSAAQHAAIADALAAGDVEEAARLLELNWRATMNGLLGWLERRNS